MKTNFNLINKKFVNFLLIYYLGIFLFGILNILLYIITFFTRVNLYTFENFEKINYAPLSNFTFFWSIFLFFISLILIFYLLKKKLSLIFFFVPVAFILLIIFIPIIEIFLSKVIGMNDYNSILYILYLFNYVNIIFYVLLCFLGIYFFLKFFKS